jgi:hypothetical protein
MDAQDLENEIERQANKVFFHDKDILLGNLHQLKNELLQRKLESEEIF